MKRCREVMNDEPFEIDSAAVFAAAFSLYQHVWKLAKVPPQLNLSECYNGGDEFMRVVMGIATKFEIWACEHLCFEKLDGVWPYLLEEHFGEACVSALGGPEALLSFDAQACLRTAWLMGLPVDVERPREVPSVMARCESFRLLVARVPPSSHLMRS